MPGRIQFHLDESVTTVVATALRQRGIDVSTSAEAGLLSASDEDQLEHALREGRVIVTRDHDFLALNQRGVAHAGIVCWLPNRQNIGEVILLLTLLWRMDSAESMNGRVEFV